jgi:hypothetical protein
MKPELPAPTRETGNAEDGRKADALHPPRSAHRVRRRPLRLFHLTTLVAAVALTLVISPALMTLIMKPASGWGRREQLAYMTSLALTFWTPILALIALVGDRSRLRRVGRSYGLSAVFAAASAILLLFVRGLNSGVLGYLRGYRVFPWLPESLFSYPAMRIVREAPAGAAAAVVAVWLILGLTGAGRKPSDWFDCFCFLFGLLWVLWCLLGHDFMVQIPWLS